MGRTKTPDLAHKIAEQRDHLSDQVSSLAERIDTDDLRNKLADRIEAIDTDKIRAHAEAGAEKVLDNATDSQGRPKRGVLVGLVVGFLALAVARKLLK